MKLKSSCCDKFRKKSKACKRCPLFAGLSKKERKLLRGSTRVEGSKKRKKGKKKKAA